MHVIDQRHSNHSRRIAGLIHEPKLTWDQVNEIRSTYVLQSRTHGLKALAEQHGVSINCIHKIVRGKTWKVTEGDGNVAPPMAGRMTAQAFTKALGHYGQSMVTLRAELDRLAQA